MTSRSNMKRFKITTNDFKLLSGLAQKLREEGWTGTETIKSKPADKKNSDEMIHEMEAWKKI